MSIVVRFSQAPFNCMEAGGEIDLHRSVFSHSCMMRKKRAKMGWCESVRNGMEYKPANGGSVEMNRVRY